MARDEYSASSDNLAAAVPHAVWRWVRVVIPVIDSPKDPKTVADWASWLGVSRGALRGWCQTAGLRAGRFLSPARMLQVAVRYPDERPENVLDFVDKRNIDSFLGVFG